MLSIIGLAMGVATTILLPACGRGAEAQPAPGASSQPAAAGSAVPVKVKPAQARELQRSVRIVGTLAGLETATLSNRVTGTVGNIYVDMGDRVKPGAKLLEIVPRRFELGLQEAESALQETLARLGAPEVPGDNFDLSESAPVKKAQSELENAKSKLDRQTPLYKQGVIKEFEYFDTASAHKVAQSALDAARDEARALLAQARQHQAQIEIKRKDLSEATIDAPDGSTPEGVAIDSYAVTSRKVSTGEYLKEGTMLFTLVAGGEELPGGGAGEQGILAICANGRRPGDS